MPTTKPALRYEDALEYIHSYDDPYQAALRDHGKQTWGLQKITELLHRLGNPHLAYPVIHVAGTKGKGSTCAFIAQALIASGLKTALYISPHLEDWRERIQINRELIPQDALAELVSDFQTLQDMPQNLSEFEISTALAFWHFKREQCDVAVIEVGLGGRLDATNVVSPLVSVITNISLDHMQLLGTTLAEIAGEKAAIIKENVPVVSAPQTTEVLSVIEEQSRSTRSPLTLVGRDILVVSKSTSLDGSTVQIGRPNQMTDVSLRLPGIFQHENAGVAYAALQTAKQQGLPIIDEAIARGLSETSWPGRMELVCRNPLILIDSAHTPYSIGELIKSLRDTVKSDRWSFVFGCMGDKDIRGMLAQIVPLVRRLVLTQAKAGRAASPLDLYEIVLGLMSELDITTQELQITLVSSVEGAAEIVLNEAGQSDLVCFAGSLSVAGEARKHIHALT